MKEKEVELLIMLSNLNLDLDTITATMLMIKQKENGYKLLIDFINSNKKDNLNRNVILRKTIEIVEKIEYE